MKTFKQHVKEGYKQGKYGAGNVGTPEANSVEDGSIGVHNIHDPKVLERVNGFVGSIANQEYLMRIKNAENNLSISVRKKIAENIIMDSFITNSFGVVDMAQQFKNESTKYGARLTLKF